MADEDGREISDNIHDGYVTPVDTDQVQNEDVILVLSDNDNWRFKNILADSTKNYIKKQLRLARYRVKKRVELARFIIDFFEEKLEDGLFFAWLGKELIGGKEKFRELLSWATKDKNTGFNRSNRAIPIELRVKVYNYRKTNSIISVDRRNDRHRVRISKKKMRYLCQDIPDDDISSVPTKQGIRFEGHPSYLHKTSQKSTCTFYFRKLIFLMAHFLH